jgi:hypothetical protein
MTAPAARIALGALGACLVMLIAAALPAAARAATRTAPAGYVIRRTQAQTLPAQSHFQGQINCPAGTVPWGGGAVTSEPGPLVNLASSFPDGHTWIVRLNNATEDPASFQVEVVCASRPAGYTVVQGTTELLPPLVQAGALATCPTGTKPLGGGGFTSSGNTSVNLNSSGPQGGSWAIEEGNGTLDDWTLTAVAVCGKATGYQVVKGPIFSSLANSIGGSNATCPAPTVVVGGGVFAASAETSVSVAATFPGSRTEWDAAVTNSSAAATTAVTEAICARHA